MLPYEDEIWEPPVYRQRHVRRDLMDLPYERLLTAALQMRFVLHEMYENLGQKLEEEDFMCAGDFVGVPSAIESALSVKRRFSHQMTSEFQYHGDNFE